MVEVEKAAEKTNEYADMPFEYIPRSLYEVDNLFIVPDERSQKYGYTREFKQTNFTRSEAVAVEMIAQCERITQMISQKLKVVAKDDDEEPVKDGEPLKELLTFLDSLKISKAMVNCGVNGFTAKLSRSHETKITEHSEQLLGEKTKKSFLSRLRP